jgi:hypothetical protein
MILHFQKELNVIVYIIEKKFKLNFNHFVTKKGRESREAYETQQQATLSSLSRSDRASTMQSHNKDTTQQATFPNLQSGSHYSAAELFL